MKPIKKEDWANVTDKNPELFITKNYKYLPLKMPNSRPFFLGKDSTNQLCLMFKATKSLLQDKSVPGDTEGLQVGIDFGFGDQEIGIVLKLKSEDYSDVFSSLCNDVISTVADIKDDKEFIDASFGRLGIWKIFLDHAGAKGLGPDRRRGLFGELYLLKELIFEKYGTDGIKFWTGPSGAMHDFEIGKFAIECKTMAGNKSQKVMISNERQLEDAGYDDLFLACIAITVRKNTTPSLVSIIKDIEKQLSSDPMNLVNFKNNLLRSGYNVIHEEMYMTEGYHVDEVLTYKVEEGFPRLLAGDLMDGIGGLKYSVDLSACTDFKIKYEKVSEKLASLGDK
jgi:hypothetical protein